MKPRQTYNEKSRNKKGNPEQQFYSSFLDVARFMRVSEADIFSEFLFKLTPASITLELLTVLQYFFKLRTKKTFRSQWLFEIGKIV